ncbi:hypothetical protein DSO57_1019891 [Entomophthora muscae]|uniref:Uncharacterized protein n=1 Tax=Entomophthora muscae TaxID=34485 RepID=A0ACC2SSQ1_9FUNG|nr:hypothetical protein DSO57_1019891 [Entomophthora muscae]
MHICGTQLPGTQQSVKYQGVKFKGVKLITVAVPTPSLDQWRAKAQEIEHKQIAGGTKHLKARYTVGDPVYTPQSQFYQIKIQPPRALQGSCRL